MKWLERLSTSLPIYRRFWPELRPHRGSLALVLLAAVGVALCQVLQPWPIQWIFDNALAPADPRPRPWSFYLWTGALAYLAIVLGHAGLQLSVDLLTARVGHMVARALRLRVFRHLALLSPRFHARNKSGDLLVRLIGDVSMVRSMLVDALLELITRSLWVVGTIGVMVWVDPLLSLILFAFLPVIGWVVRRMAGAIRGAVRKQRKKEGALADFLHEAIAATEVIQSLGREGEIVHRFARDNRSSERAGMRAAKLAAKLGASVHSLLGSGVALTLALGGWRVAQGHLSPGELLVFLSYVRGLLKPVRSASRNSEKIAKGAACGERLLEVLDEPVAIRSDPDAPSAPERPAVLAFEDVWFRYDDERDALRGFSAVLRRGELTGVFGRSGAGKSTMAALAVRLYDPDRGTVRLDGHDLRRLELGSLRARFGVCLQRSVLFGDSIRENLLLGKPEASEEELWRALDAAGAGDLVRGLPKGLDTLLGSAGVGLSGGQGRRVALARTLLRDSPIVIADEPFTGLDRAAAARVQATLKALARDALVVVIAHERDFLDAYDRVLFVEDGRVEGVGSHDELRRESAAYRETLMTAAALEETG
jgi:ATP-binding cassette subfamily B protein